jgi:hypothetical protein
VIHKSSSGGFFALSPSHLHIIASDIDHPMASTTKPNANGHGLVQSNEQPPLRIRIYRPSDWEQVKPIFVAGIRAPISVAVRDMYTWPSLYPVYALVGGGVAWLGRGVWKVASRLGLQILRTEDPWNWVRHAGRALIENWTWKESTAWGSIGLGFVTWGVIRWKLDQAYKGYVQMSLNADLKDIPKHYGLERVPPSLKDELNGQGEGEEWRPKGTTAFWVAEIGDEVVGCIGLGGSFVHGLPFAPSQPSMSAY